MKHEKGDVVLIVEDKEATHKFEKSEQVFIIDVFQDGLPSHYHVESAKGVHGFVKENQCRSYNVCAN